MAVGGGVVLVGLIIAVVLLLTKGSPPSHGSSAGSTTGSSSPPPSTAQATTAPASTPPVTGPTIPAAFAGTWSGTATQSAIGVSGVSETNSISFTFVAGATTISETNQPGNCLNTLTLTGQTATVLTFSEPQTAACAAGTVTFTLHGTKLHYRWTDNIEQNVADLHKT